MSVVPCVFCDRQVDTDFFEFCPSCNRDPFGENLFCGDCEEFNSVNCDVDCQEESPACGDYVDL